MPRTHKIATLHSRVPSVVGPILPESLSGLQYRIRASELGLSHNDAVGTWLDETVNNYDAVQSTSAKKPTFLENQFVNGEPGVAFDGGDHLRHAAANWQSDASGTMVGVFRDVNTAPGNMSMFSTGDEGSVFQSYWYFGLRREGAPLKMHGGYVRFETGTPMTAAGSDIVQDLFAHVMVLRCDGVTFDMCMDGQWQALDFGSGSNDGRWLSSVPNRDSFTIGNLKTSAEANFLVGTLGEIFYYDDAKLDSEIAGLVAYTQQTYGTV